MIDTLGTPVTNNTPQQFSFALDNSQPIKRIEIASHNKLDNDDGMEAEGDGQTVDFISGIDSRGNVIGGKKKKKEKLVIPMPEGWAAQFKNYEYKKLAEKIKNGEAMEEEEEDITRDTTTTRAVSVSAEISVQTEPDELSDMDDATYEYLRSLPPILRNRPPGLDKIIDEKDRFLFDVQSRPDEADLEAYNRMPLEEYGIAMLRGMGWTEGMPIGKNAQHVVPVIQFIRQPPRVGLGAMVKVQEVKRPEGWIRKPGDPKHPPAPAALPKDMDGRVRHWKTIDEKLKPVKEPFYQGSRLFITGGTHRGLTGRTFMKQEDKVVVILPSDERVVVHVRDLKELDEHDPVPTLPSQDNSKSLSISARYIPDPYQKPESSSKQTPDSSLQKSDSSLQKSDSKPKSESSKSKSSKHKSSRKHKSSKNKSKDKSSSKDKHKKNSKKHKKRKRSSSTSSSSESSGPETTQPVQPTEPRWITTDIRVKICSKSISEGRYYCKYAWIIDVLPENRCVLRLEDSGTLLDNIKQSDLETVVPTSGQVKVVRGQYCGELGTVYEKIPAKNEVYVQLEDNLEIYLMSYDDVAQVRS
jgi:G patch domain/KOW motif-containing protein